MVQRFMTRASRISDTIETTSMIDAHVRFGQPKLWCQVWCWQQRECLVQRFNGILLRSSIIFETVPIETNLRNDVTWAKYFGHEFFDLFIREWCRCRFCLIYWLPRSFCIRHWSSLPHFYWSILVRFCPVCTRLVLLFVDNVSRVCSLWRTMQI